MTTTESVASQGDASPAGGDRVLISLMTSRADPDPGSDPLSVDEFIACTTTFTTIPMGPLRARFPDLSPKKLADKAKAGPCLMPGLAGPPRDGKRGKATASNLLALDVEQLTGGPVPPHPAKVWEKLKALNTTAVMHSTFKSEPEAWRYRIFVLIDRELVMAEEDRTRKALTRWLAENLSVLEALDDASYSVDRVLYLPRCPDDGPPPLAEFVIVRHDDGRLRGLDPALADDVKSDDGTPPRLEAPPRSAAPGNRQPADAELVRSLLAAIPNETLPRDKWLRVGFIVKRELGEAGFPLWQDFSQRYPGNTEDEIETRWNGLNVNDDRAAEHEVHIGSLIDMARQYGWNRQVFDNTRLTELMADMRRMSNLRPGLSDAAAGLAGVREAPPAASSSPLLAWVEANKVTRLVPVSELPPTEWLIRYIHARKYVGLTAGVGGLAKTQLMLTEIVSIATGVDLLDHGGVRKGRVLLLNKEESLADIQKRLRAVVMHHRTRLGLSIEQVERAGWQKLLGPLAGPPTEQAASVEGFDFGGNLVVTSGRDLPLEFGREHRGEWSLNVEELRDVAQLVTHYGAAMLVIDPLILFHNLNENDNKQMGKLMAALGGMAEALNIAIEVVLHNRKGGAAEGDGSADAIRGASALVAQARRARVLKRMTAKEAGALGVAARDAPRHFRLENAKGNLQPPPEKEDWFHVASTPIDNAADDLSGDVLGVPERFTPLPVLAGLTYEQLTLIHQAAGGEPGECKVNYRPGKDGTMAGWFADRVAWALGWTALPAPGTAAHEAYRAASNRRLKALVERGVLAIEAVGGIAARRGRDDKVQCYRQGRLPGEPEWARLQTDDSAPEPV